MYPTTAGRNFAEVLRIIIDSLQLTDTYSLVTPANWQPSVKVVIPSNISNELAD
jgi:alkyl hydroperoxide reductase subunit AhpC